MGFVSGANEQLGNFACWKSLIAVRLIAESLPRRLEPKNANLKRKAH